MKNFVNFLKSQSLSRKTIRNYASDVSQFLSWITKSRRHHANTSLGSSYNFSPGSNYKRVGASEQERKRTPPDLDRVGPEHPQSLRRALEPADFANYFTYLNSLNIPRSTLARHLASLRQFARFLNLDINLDNPPLPLFPTLLKNFRSHLTSARGRSSFGRKSRYKHKTVANYLSDVRHYLTWVENHVQS